ncbi:MAG: hypothetical protein JWQ04_2339 [Pedosphaera sp.]|nr:hypothetical protein [Pedosphaera sp.]
MAREGLKIVQHMNRRNRTILISTTSLVLAGFLFWAGRALVGPASTTAEQVVSYVNSVDLARLPSAERRAALRRLEDRVNALTLEERRKWWAEGKWHRWFDQMTEEEKGRYIEATLPTGFKQVMNAFENLSQDRRVRAIDVAMQQLKQTHRLVTDREPGHEAGMYGTNPPPVLSPELENRARMVGFRTFYAESTAQTKAELAPLLEELQHQLEVGGHPGQ